jgi:hypothetical protein
MSDARCPYCGAAAADARAEIAHMNTAHPDVVAQRLRDAGISEAEQAHLNARWPVDVEALPDDLLPIVLGALDLAYYRTVDQGVAEDLQTAVAHELADRVGKLPEYKGER